MTITLNLSSELERHLVREAKREGLALEAYTLQLLERALPRRDRNTKLKTLLQSWIDEDDAEEQRETGAYLVETLDEDRFADRSHFPPDLKGKTW